MFKSNPQPQEANPYELALEDIFGKQQTDSSWNVQPYAQRVRLPLRVLCINNDKKAWIFER
jgi:hypothetical protein